jgi:hypothetical protein
MTVSTTPGGNYNGAEMRYKLHPQVAIFYQRSTAVTLFVYPPL